MMIRSWTFRESFHFFYYDLSSESASELRPLLSPDEINELSRITSPARSQTFSASRARLRLHLSQLLNCQPTDLTFTCDTYGKRRLAYPKSDVTFSISHSAERMLIVISTTGEQLGVDLEHFRTDVDLHLIAAHLFNEEEKATIQRLDGQEQKQKALDIWCLKEARFKMQGNSSLRQNDERTEYIQLESPYFAVLCYRPCEPTRPRNSLDAQGRF